MNDRILVKVSANESGIAFQTVTKKRKSPHRFYILRSELERLKREGSVITCDLRSFARLQYDPDKSAVSIRFIWLSASDRVEFTGWEQTVRLPYDTLAEFADHGLTGVGPKQWKTLSLENRRLPKLDFSAADNLHAALSNKIVRRRLVRFLRDHFNWPGADRICFYNDFLPYSFSFREFRNGRPGICGGVILHSQEDPHRAYYSLHT